jgi:hypothetical protein
MSTNPQFYEITVKDAINLSVGIELTLSKLNYLSRKCATLKYDLYNELAYNGLTAYARTISAELLDNKKELQSLESSILKLAHNKQLFSNCL